jgi:hypothetical protein
MNSKQHVAVGGALVAVALFMSVCVTCVATGPVIITLALTASVVLAGAGAPGTGAWVWPLALGASHAMAGLTVGAVNGAWTFALASSGAGIGAIVLAYVGGAMSRRGIYRLQN